MNRLNASSRPWWAPGIAWIYFAVLFLSLCFLAFLWKSGERLVRSDSFGHIRWALVLAGESNVMDRSKAALALFQEGRFDSLILSGPAIFRTHHESEFTEEWLLSKGFPKDRIFQLPHNARSTQEEAEAIVPQLRLLGIDTVLIITSNFHSRRAALILQKLAGDSPVVKVYAAEDPDFDPKAWWAGRDSRIIWALEWLKTIHSDLELIGQKPVVGASETVLLEPNPRALAGSSPVSASSDSCLIPANVPGADTGKTSAGRNLTADSSNRTDSANTLLENAKPGKAKLAGSARRKKKR